MSLSFFLKPLMLDDYRHMLPVSFSLVPFSFPISFSLVIIGLELGHEHEARHLHLKRR